MASGDEVRRERLKKYLSEADGIKKRRNKPKMTISIRGDQNIVGDGNTINLGPIPPVENVVVVKTGDGVITAAQKAEINKLFDQLYGLRGAVRKSRVEMRALRKAFNNYMNVNRYDEILKEDFPRAIGWLRRQIAIVNSMPSAPKKSATWRNDRIRAVSARCKQFPDGEARMRAYMKKHFDKTSRTDLGDDELERLYRHVMGWRS